MSCESFGELLAQYEAVTFKCVATGRQTSAESGHQGSGIHQTKISAQR